MQFVTTDGLYVCVFWSVYYFDVSLVLLECPDIIFYLAVIVTFLFCRRLSVQLERRKVNCFWQTLILN